MKREIREVGNGTFQVTAYDERWYARPAFDPATGLPASFEFVPSVTWIAGHYPKGVGFYKWLANKGWDEAAAIREAAADKGSVVHQACADLIDGKTVALTSEYVEPSTGAPRVLALEEYEALLSFRDWWAAARPTTLLRDAVVWGDGYAGTLDWLGTLGDPSGLWLIDFKTSSQVWPEHELQVSAYKAALLDAPPSELAGRFVQEGIPLVRLGILQLGYRLNKRKWKLTEVPDCYDLFLAARKIWEKETAGQAPTKAEYPLELTLAYGPIPESTSKIKRGRKTNGEPAQPSLAPALEASLAAVKETR